MKAYETQPAVRLMGRILAVGFIAALACGCGMIADKDRIVVAEMEGETITRGDLMEVIREKPPEERPVIRTREDLAEALQNHIDDEIKRRLGQRLEREGVISVPRERAEQVFAQSNPELMVDLPNPEEWGMDDAMLAAMQDEREFGIDRAHDRLLGEEAVMYRIRQALQHGNIAISEEEYEEAFRRREDQLRHPEELTVRGLFFPQTRPGVQALAAEARQQLDEGEDFEEVAERYEEEGGAQAVPRARLERDPRDPATQRYQAFWHTASGSEEGEIIGPVMVPSPQMGQRQLPDSFFVAEILERTPGEPKTLEEAREELQGPILYRKMMEQLRDEFEVTVYEDRLPDPALLDPEQQTGPIPGTESEQELPMPAPETDRPRTPSMGPGQPGEPGPSPMPGGPPQQPRPGGMGGMMPGAR
ncbi:MAG: peptidyl-prolyl cis-trans isomerase [Candidatus Hydrogenedentota bacterium]